MILLKEISVSDLWFLFLDMPKITVVYDTHEQCESDDREYNDMTCVYDMIKICSNPERILLWNRDNGNRMSLKYINKIYISGDVSDVGFLLSVVCKQQCSGDIAERTFNLVIIKCNT